MMKKGELVGDSLKDVLLWIIFFIIAAGVISYFLIKGLTG